MQRAAWCYGDNSYATSASVPTNIDRKTMMLDGGGGMLGITPSCGGELSLRCFPKPPPDRIVGHDGEYEQHSNHDHRNADDV